MVIIDKHETRAADRRFLGRRRWHGTFPRSALVPLPGRHRFAFLHVSGAYLPCSFVPTALSLSIDDPLHQARLPPLPPFSFAHTLSFGARPAPLSSSLPLSSGLRRLRAYARLCSGARVLCEFHSQLHETVCAAPRPRLHFLGCHGLLFLGAVRRRGAGAVPHVTRASHNRARVFSLSFFLSTATDIVIRPLFSAHV